MRSPPTARPRRASGREPACALDASATRHATTAARRASVSTRSPRRASAPSASSPTRGAEQVVRQRDLTDAPLRKLLLLRPRRNQQGATGGDFVGVTSVLSGGPRPEGALPRWPHRRHGHGALGAPSRRANPNARPHTARRYPRPATTTAAERAFRRARASGLHAPAPVPTDLRHGAGQRGTQASAQGPLRPAQAARVPASSLTSRPSPTAPPRPASTRRVTISPTGPPPLEPTPHCVNSGGELAETPGQGAACAP